MWHTLFGLLFDLSDSFSSLLLKSVPWTPLQFFSSPRKKSPGPPPVRGPCNWSLVSFPFSLCILPSPCCLFTSFFLLGLQHDCIILGAWFQIYHLVSYFICLFPELFQPLWLLWGIYFFKKVDNSFPLFWRSSRFVDVPTNSLRL